MRTLAIGLTGAVLVPTGLALAAVFGSFAMMYVPECRQFALQAANPHCSDPLYFIYGGMILAAGGLAAAIAAGGTAVIRLLRR